jgi:DNA (cytosine-5)-methyltransferase 1
VHGDAPAAKPTAVDLFCGAGGVTTGFKAAGIRVLAAVDADPTACKTYKVNHPEVTVYTEDLRKLSPRKLRRRIHLRKGELTVLTACAPCQTYSTLGAKNKKPRDNRNGLVGRVMDFVEEFAPQAMVMENVPLLAEQRPFADARRRLRRLRYGVWYGVVNAADFGVAQRRRRLVLIALRDTADSAVPALTTSDPRLYQFSKGRTVRDTFLEITQANGQLATDPLSIPRLKYPDLVARRIAAISRDGGSRSDLPDDLILKCHKKLKVKAAQNVYGRMRWDDVAPTLTTRCTTPACGRYLHPEENRAITLREAAALQSFPMDYKLEGTNLAMQAQIGNAVPPLLAQAVGTLVLAALDEATVTRATARPVVHRLAHAHRGRPSRTPERHHRLSQSRPPGRRDGSARRRQTVRSMAER